MRIPPGKLPPTIIFWAKSLESESLLLEMTEIENWRGCVMQPLDSHVLNSLHLGPYDSTLSVGACWTF